MNTICIEKKKSNHSLKNIYKDIFTPEKNPQLIFQRQDLMLPRLTSNSLCKKGCLWTSDSPVSTSWVVELQSLAIMLSFMWRWGCQTCTLPSYISNPSYIFLRESIDQYSLCGPEGGLSLVLTHLIQPVQDSDYRHESQCPTSSLILILLINC